MTSETALFAALCALALLGLLYLGSPLLYAGGQRFEARDTELDELMIERERSYTALADLDFDRECGKISDADYERLRADLMRETAHILAEMDARIEARGGSPTAAAGAVDDDLLEREIEAFKKARERY